jgi:hypothetical protein
MALHCFQGGCNVAWRRCMTASIICLILVSAPLLWDFAMFRFNMYILKVTPLPSLVGVLTFALRSGMILYASNRHRHASAWTRGGCVTFVFANVIAKVIILADEFSSAFMSVAVASDTFSNGCGDTVRMNVTSTACGQYVWSVFEDILFESPVSLLKFWMPMAGDALAGLTVVVKL